MTDFQDDKKENEMFDYLIFKLAEKDYAIPLLQVREVIEMQESTFVPGYPAYFKGILNLRGEITSVIDLSQKLGVTKGQNSAKAIIVLDSSPLIGFMVDSVESVFSLLAKEINAVPENEINIHSELLKGVAAKNEKFILLLDTEKVFGYDKFQHDQESLVA